MDNKNKHGLSRNIARKIKKIVRENAGYGCVICGFGIYQYEYVDPEYCDAKEHDPKRITLLCGRCHDLVTRGIYSKNTVFEAMKHPKCLEDGFSRGVFDCGRRLPIIQVGDNLFRADGSFVLFEIYGKELLRFDYFLEKNRGVLLLSGEFYNTNEELILSIKNNEWKASIGKWDINARGCNLSFCNQDKRTYLEIENIPDDRLIIRELDMAYKGFSFQVNQKTGMTVRKPGGGAINMMNVLVTLRGWKKKVGIFAGSKIDLEKCVAAVALKVE